MILTCVLCFFFFFEYWVFYFEYCCIPLYKRAIIYYFTSCFTYEFFSKFLFLK